MIFGSCTWRIILPPKIFSISKKQVLMRCVCHLITDWSHHKTLPVCSVRKALPFSTRSFNGAKTLVLPSCWICIPVLEGSRTVRISVFYRHYATFIFGLFDLTHSVSSELPRPLRRSRIFVLERRRRWSLAGTRCTSLMGISRTVLSSDRSDSGIQPTTDRGYLARNCQTLCE